MRRKTRNIISLIVLLLALSAVGIGYYLFNKGPIDVQHGNAISIQAGELYKAYAEDPSAQTKYTGKLLLVSGGVYGMASNQAHKRIVLLKINENGAYVNCTMEGKAENLHMNDKVNIKGICSGIGEGDADLGIKGDVYLTRCYLVK